MKLEDIWVVRARDYNKWWRPKGNGYTNELIAAGAYTREEAEKAARRKSPHIDSDGREHYTDKAMPLLRALQGLVRGDGTVGSMLLTEEQICQIESKS